MRPGGRLGVVLHAERGQPAGVVAQLEAFDDVVVEADVTDRGASVDAIQAGENRERFKQVVASIGAETASSSRRR